MEWTDLEDIAEALMEERPEEDPTYVRFTDLRTWVLDLSDFRGDPERCNERILEAIQSAWLELWEESKDN